MELPISLFEEITGPKAVLASVGAPESDRRKQHRFSFVARATIHTSQSGGEGPGAVVILRDVSVGSIGFIHFEAIAAGTLFVIKFKGEAGRTFRLRCVGERCEPGGVGGKQFCVGATFEELIEPGAEEVKAIVAAHAQAAQNAPAAEPVVEAPKRNRIFVQKKTEAPAAATAMPFAPPTPPVVAAPVVIAPAAQPEPAAVPEPIVIPAAPMPEPEAIVVAQAVESVPAPVEELAAPAQSAAEVPPSLSMMMMLAENAPPARPAPDHVDGIPAQGPVATGHNHQVVAQVKNRLLKQGQVLHSVTRRLDEAHQELNVQKALAIDLSRERDDLHNRLAMLETQLLQEREQAMQFIEQLKSEFAPMKETLAQLQAKSDADDKSIAELAAMLGGEMVEVDAAEAHRKLARREGVWIGGLRKTASDRERQALRSTLSLR